MTTSQLTPEEFAILNNRYDASRGRARFDADLAQTAALRRRDVYAGLVSRGLIAEDGALTDAGLAALSPYRVQGAVILAAGAATRFIPLSLEQPKGLYEVRGERLIERQIRQLKDAGIEDITIVLGYKKDMFAYLEKQYGVRLVFNPAYNVKNNIASILAAKEHLENTYLCVCDSYFTENPFRSFEYRSFYAGFATTEQRGEMYARIDGDGRIIGMEEGEAGGLMLLGHCFWNREFARAFVKLAEADRETGAYDTLFWEWLVRDNLEALPPLHYKEYAPGTIFEFDYFEQLREFDVGYKSHARSDIIRNIKLVFRCDEEDVTDFRTVHEGLTNTSFIFGIDGVDYIYRHPGDGTESIIDRRNEKTSLIRAKQFGFDPTYVYMDSVEGWKISRFVPEFREPDYGCFEDSRRVIGVMRRLHAAPITVDYGMRPWEDALAMERLLKEKDASCFEAHEALKESVRTLWERIAGDGVAPCFCHGDTYKHNWMLLPDGGTILIDWEYSGCSDPGVDVGYYIVDAEYGFDDARRFILEYLGDDATPALEFHFMAYVAIIAYYWFVWAMYRESCGAKMGKVTEAWRAMAERYAAFLAEK